MIEYKEFTRPSSSGEGELFCRSWSPKEPAAIVELSHGMAEHSGRYIRIGHLLAENGFAVYAHDHLGHGQSALGHPGTFALKKGGFDFAAEDLMRGLDCASAEHPGLKRFLIGHSMGSILSGLCANRWDDRLDGLVLLGTPTPNPAAGLFLFLCRLTTAFRGYVWISPFLNRLLDGATSGTGEEQLSERQWLSYNRESNLAFMSDPLCGCIFSCSANGEAAAGLREFGSSRWGGGVPKDLPVLIMAGLDDSAGSFGKAPRHYAGQLRKYGVKDVTLELIPHARHEVLNEPDTAQTDDILIRWLSSHSR